MKLHHGSSFFVVKKDIFKSLPTYHPFFNFSKRGLSIIKHEHENLNIPSVCALGYG